MGAKATIRQSSHAYPSQDVDYIIVEDQFVTYGHSSTIDRSVLENKKMGYNFLDDQMRIEIFKRIPE